jgi:hypothetical protein
MVNVMKRLFGHVFGVEPAWMYTQAGGEIELESAVSGKREPCRGQI